MDQFPFILCCFNGIVVSIGVAKGNRRSAKGEGVRVSKHLANVELQAGDGVGVGDRELKDETLSNLHRPRVGDIVGHLQVILHRDGLQVARRDQSLL